jgi:Ran GTPase-activating protein (RanGAP) involved in mRNA processing and transport
VLSAFAECPFFQQLEHLSFRNVDFGSSVFDAFEKSPFIRNIKSLDLSDNALNDEGWERIASLPLDSLVKLNLAGTNGSDVGLEAIARSRHLTKLQRLEVAWNQIGWKGTEALAASDMLSNLEILDMAENPVEGG